MKKYAFFVVLFNRQTKQTQKKHTFHFYDYTMYKETNTNIYKNSQISSYLLMQWIGINKPPNQEVFSCIATNKKSTYTLN